MGLVPLYEQNREIAPSFLLPPSLPPFLSLPLSLPYEDSGRRWSSANQEVCSHQNQFLILDFLASRIMRNAFFLFIGHPVYCIFIIAVKTGEVITHSISYILRIISFKVRKVPIPAHISPLLLVFKFEGRVQFCSSLYFFHNSIYSCCCRAIPQCLSCTALDKCMWTNACGRSTPPVRAF